MRFQTLVPVAICAAFLIGCKSGDTASTTSTSDATTTGGSQKAPPVADAAPKGDTKLVGTWTNTAPDTTGAKTSFKFDADGTYTMTAAGIPPGQKAEISTEVKGTYTNADDKLGLKITSAVMSSSDPKVQPELDKTNAAMKDTSKLPVATGKLEWKDKDNAVLTMDPTPGSSEKPEVYTLKRTA